jgi:NCS1 family nucleobase:cation symporter-1
MTAPVLEREAPFTLDDPAPRVLGLLDQSGLWASLGITLTLPAIAGYVLINGMSLAAAIVAIVAGSVVGSVLLGLAAMAGARTGAPAMVLMRGLFGVRGSWVPTGLNLAQCLGWTYVEVSVIATAGHGLVHGLPLWVLTVGAGVVATAMALWPLGSVRQLRRFAVFVATIATVYLFVRVLVKDTLPSFTHGSWHGWVGSFDLVLAIPISWVPLAADYSRHSRSSKAAFGGAVLGFAPACALYFTLGVLAIAAIPSAQGDGLGALVALPAAGLAVAFLVLDEVDEAFANLYSTAVSVQNIVPRADRRVLVTLVGTMATVLALVIGNDYSSYETFLLLIGAVFVPLTAILVVEFFVLGRGKSWDVSSTAKGRISLGLPWIAGFAAYQLVAPTAIYHWDSWASWWLHRQHTVFDGRPPSWLSASVAALVVASVLTLALGWTSRAARRG